MGLRSLALLAVPALMAAAPPGGASCTGCHAGGDTGLPAIAGRPAAENDAAMAAFRDGSRPATLMTRIARGFTPDETHAISAWLEGRR